MSVLDPRISSRPRCTWSRASIRDSPCIRNLDPDPSACGTSRRSRIRRLVCGIRWRCCKSLPWNSPFRPAGIPRSGPPGRDRVGSKTSRPGNLVGRCTGCSHCCRCSALLPLLTRRGPGRAAVRRRRAAARVWEEACRLWAPATRTEYRESTYQWICGTGLQYWFRFEKSLPSNSAENLGEDGQATHSYWPDMPSAFDFP